MQQLARRILSRVDEWYERRHHLRALGPVLRIGYTSYAGPPLEFPDGTVLRENDLVGHLHFNNASIAEIGNGPTQRIGFRFAKLMRESLRLLAEASQSDPELSRIRVFHGVTWIPEHGTAVGFVSSPRNLSLRTRILARYFRLLHWAFAPDGRGGKANATPRDYWLTQRMLAQNLGKLSSKANG